VNLRHHARLAILGHAANEAYRQGLLDLRGPDRAFGMPRKSVHFSTSIDQTFPMRVWLSDWEHGETRIAAAIWPTDEVDDWLHVVRADEFAGEVFTTGYLNRGSSIWISAADDRAIYIAQPRLEILRMLSGLKIKSDDLKIHHRTR
jgi:hypothetical protein